MTQRERQTPKGGTVPFTGPVGSSIVSSFSLWESIFRSASQARQVELLTRARNCGVLYSHQLPDVAATTAPRTIPPTAFLNGQCRELPAISPPAIVPVDTALDASQRQAVARALHTPDICLIAGIPGSGKSRVVVEIIIQAIARGERVLFLAPGAAGLDHILDTLSHQEQICPVRCLASDETFEHLPTTICSLTLDERVRFFREQTAPQAREAVVNARHQVDELRRQEEVWNHLSRLVASHAELSMQVAALTARRSTLSEEVLTLARNQPDVASPFGAALAAIRHDYETASIHLDDCQADVRAEQEKVRAALDASNTDEAKLRPLVEARHGLRFWSSAWWQSLAHGNLHDQLEELHARRKELEAAAVHLTAKSLALESDQSTAKATFQSSFDRLVNAEVERRLTDLNRELSEVTEKADRLVVEGNEIAGTLDAATRLSSLSTDAVNEGRTALICQLAKANEALIAAEQWVAAVEEVLPNLPAQLMSSANVVAAPIEVFAGTSHYGNNAASFDLLLVEDADHITESEFVQVARRARRWVLVGENALDFMPSGSSRSTYPTNLNSTFFHHVWQNLHAEPRRLTCSWLRREDGRLCCRLRPITTGEQKWIETEHVIDRPDVELHIASPPRAVPELVEVVFPSTVSAAEAKAYVFRELEELTIQARGRELRWDEGPGCLLLRLDRTEPAELEAIPLISGVTELIGPASPGDPDETIPFLTYALAFDLTAGWSREKAEEWVTRHTGLRDRRRTTFLGSPYRMRPALARFVAGFLAVGGLETDASGSSLPNSEPAVEFIPIPKLETKSETRRPGLPDSRRRGGATVAAPRPRVVKGGAGLEIELAAPRRPDVLPAELRAMLPAQGLVNYLEARTIIHDLEALVSDSVFQAEAERWQRTESNQLNRGCAIAVIALYPSQAQLIHQLLINTPTLSASRLAIEVGIPEYFRQRECLVALVSLTRSHSHRPVSFGKGPQSLTLALTRARARLLLYGDPGTLNRRSQCADPVDHLDAPAANRERAIVNHLVAYLQGHDPCGSNFRLRQGSST